MLEPTRYPQGTGPENLIASWTHGNVKVFFFDNAFKDKTPEELAEIDDQINEVALRNYRKLVAMGEM